MFEVQNKKYLFVKKTCFCCTQHNIVRKNIASIVLHKWFEKFITACIFINSILLTTREYRNKYDPDYESKWNKIVDLVDLIFSVVFIAECVMKIMVMGFCRHKYAYMRNAWNRLDFIIVVISLSNFIPDQDNRYLKVLRSVRVLKPLRSIGIFKEMRLLMKTIAASVT